METASDLTSRLPVKQHMKNMKKIFRLLYELDHYQFGLSAAAEFFFVTISYLTLLLSAWVLNGITGAFIGFKERYGFSPMIGIGLFLGLIFLNRMVYTVLDKQLNLRRNVLQDSYELLVTDKIMEMDFSIVDSPVLMTIRQRMKKDNNWGAGIFTFLWGFDGVVRNGYKLIFSLAVGVPVLVQIWQSQNLEACAVMILAILAAIWCSWVILQKEGQINQYLLNDMFDTPQEMAQKASLVWPFCTGEQYHYHDGKDVRIYDGEELFEEYVFGRMRKYEQSYVHWLAGKIGKKEAYNSASEKLVSALPYLAAGFAALKGGLTAGTLVGSAGALGKLSDSIRGIFYGCHMMASAARAQLSTLELVEMADEMYKGKLPVEKRSDNQYEIEFLHVWFAYPGSKDYALKDFSFKMRVGEKLAIVGKNGSGKTTMIKLLCRLYEPTKGQILLNGVDIRKFDMKEYRQLFSVVFQDLQLFSLKLGENVAGSRVYDRQRAAECLEDAGFGIRLSELSGGLDSYLYKEYADDGVEVSGGEAQKIAIARALYKDAPFVLLDEPTAALDPKAEYEIYSGFDRMVGTKTAIYISHRLSSCRFCDDIAVFHEGQLIQRGSHEMLVAQTEGKYYELWQAQAQYYQ